MFPAPFLNLMGIAHGQSEAFRRGIAMAQQVGSVNDGRFCVKWKLGILLIMEMYNCVNALTNK